MEGLRRTWQQLVYTFSSEDRYAGFSGGDSSENKSGGISESFAGLDGSQIQLNEYIDGVDGGSNEGVSETLLAWRHIESWCSDHHPDLYCTLSSACTKNDITRAESDLSISFPAAVRASLRVHDGQEDVEAMQGSSGLIYGMKLMALDEIVLMTQTWRNVATSLQRQMARLEQQRRMESSAELAKPGVTPQAVKQKGYGKVTSQDYGGNNPHLRKDISQNYNKKFKMDNIPRQGSVPPLAVQAVYAHPGWIPLVTDNSGNHIGIDLAPGPKGKYAQVILFGRDFDTKFVVADNWGDFLLNFVNDLENGNWVLVDNTDDFLNGEGDLMFVEKGSNGPILEYLGVLKKRAWDKWQKTKGPNFSVPSTSSTASHPALNVSMVSSAGSSGQSDTRDSNGANIDDAGSVTSMTDDKVPDVIVEESKLRLNDDKQNMTLEDGTEKTSNIPKNEVTEKQPDLDSEEPKTEEKSESKAQHSDTKVATIESNEDMAESKADASETNVNTAESKQAAAEATSKTTEDKQDDSSIVDNKTEVSDKTAPVSNSKSVDHSSQSKDNGNKQSDINVKKSEQDSKSKDGSVDALNEEFENIAL